MGLLTRKWHQAQLNIQQHISCIINIDDINDEIFGTGTLTCPQNSQALTNIYIYYVYVGVQGHSCYELTLTWVTLAVGCQLQDAHHHHEEMAVGDADHLPAFRLFQLLPPLAQKIYGICFCRGYQHSLSWGLDTVSFNFSVGRGITWP